MSEHKPDMMAAEQEAVSVSDYPEHDKLKAISDQSQAIGEFLDWLMHGGLDESDHHPGDRKRESYGSVELAYRRHRHWHDEGERDSDLTPLNWPIKRILSAYFEINEEVIEVEKRAMLELLRAANTDGPTEARKEALL